LDAIAQCMGVLHCVVEAESADDHDRAHALDFAVGQLDVNIQKARDFLYCSVFKKREEADAL
jgi:hypothetical protein